MTTSVSRARRVMSATVVLVCVARPALPQQETSIRASASAAAVTAAAEQTTDHHRRPALFWSGVALGIAGVTSAVLGVTTSRVESTSTGNAPAGTFQSCVALQQRDPIYASSSCDALKGKNGAMLWSGVAIGAAGAALIVADHGIHAEVAGGAFRVFRIVRF